MLHTSPYTLAQLNTQTALDVLAKLGGLYEHSPWVVERALEQRPFASLAAFKVALAQTLAAASLDEQLGLIRAHPELAGKAMVSKTLTTESTHEQSKAGLTDCTPEEFDKLQKLNADYNAKFGFPFVLAVRGPRGLGLDKAQIISTFERRLLNAVAFECAECLRQINRIAEIRLDDQFGLEPTLGHQVWDWHEALAAFSEPEYQARGELTVTYLTQAHLDCARHLAARMREVGFDEVHIDAVGNVVGLYKSDDPNAKTLLTGSHYDTVRNGGKYDGRLGIFVPMLCVQTLKRKGKRLPFHLELVAFAEEEGQRYKAVFLGSGALTGDFDPRWLDQEDSDGLSMRQAMQAAGLPAELSAIHAIKRNASQYLGFVEVHIEQGPVLNELHLPLGVVTSINGSMRYLCAVQGMASHAGTTPMQRRLDAAAAVAEIVLAIEQAANKRADLVATVGQLHVTSGSINVIPGACTFSIDLRAPQNALRDALENDIVNAAQAICQNRGVHLTMERTLIADAAPSDPAWQRRFEDAVQALGLPVHRMTSGAGHDAMKLHTVMPQAMLFVRGENSGISHNPLESTTSHDMDLGVQAFLHLLENHVD